MTRMGRIAAIDMLPLPARDRRSAIDGPLLRGLRRGFGRVGAALGSMLGQMVLATALFVGCGIYTFAIVPILSMPPLTQPDPMDATVGALNVRMQDAMVASDDVSGALVQIAHDPLIRRVERHNPGFRYFVARGNATAGTGKPYYFHALGLDRFDRLRNTIDQPDLCAQLQRPIRDDRGAGYIAYSNCGRLSYLEFRGLRHPVAIPLPTPVQAYSRWLWSYSRDFLLPALGIFVLLVAILLVNVVRIRQVAKLTGDLGSDVPERMLPHEGLPNEVIPLVRAVNGMIARVDEAQRRRRFFLSAAAHELRTPLSVLRMRLEIMEEGELKTKLVRDLSRLTALSNDLLALMGIEGRKRPFQPVYLADCCLAAINGLAPIAASKDVTLRFADAETGSIIAGDAALIEVAVTNLVDNAISFAPPGTEVSVALDGAGGFVVRDFGPGLPADRADALFEPFVRGGMRRPGHGLGLAIVKAIAELHGGAVCAADAVGGGARFAMRFPEAGGDDRTASLRTG